MTIITSHRQASIDEIAAEMDRRGRVIESLEDERDELHRRAEKAEAALAARPSVPDDLRHALANIVDEFESTLALYHKYGPDYTLSGGIEVFEASTLLDREALIQAGRAALNAATPAPAVRATEVEAEIAAIRAFIAADKAIALIDVRPHHIASFRDHNPCMEPLRAALAAARKGSAP